MLGLEGNSWETRHNSLPDDKDKNKTSKNSAEEAHLV